jgi:hypothetical protein
MKKERKIARELNATMAHSVALEARELRINELKWLYEAEDNLEEKKTIMKTMKVIILQDPPTYVNIDDSDDENPVSSYSSSAKVVKASSLTGDDVAHATPVTELWGEDADSDSGDEIDYDEPLCAMKENDSHFEKELSAMKENYSHFEKENSAMKENDSHFEKEHSAMKENYSHFEKENSAMKENDSHFEKEHSAIVRIYHNHKHYIYVPVHEFTYRNDIPYYSDKYYV